MSQNNTTVPGYVNYFRKLAVTHQWLLHNPASENGDAPPEENHFTRWSVDEVVTNLRTKIGWPALLLELYEVTTRASNNYDVKGLYAGAFTVLDAAEMGNYQSELNAFDKCQTIYEDLLQQIWQDHYGRNKDRCETPFQEFSFDGLQITPVGPLFSNQFGWRIEFQFRPRHLINISQPPATGVFIEPSSSS